MTDRALVVALVSSLSVIACAEPPAADADDAAVTASGDSGAPDVAPPGPDLSVEPEVAPEPACTTDAECDDGDLCTGVETCTPEGACAPGEPVQCDDGDPCTFDGCLAVAGGCVAVPDLVQCDDGDPCTADTCLASGCLHEAANCDDDDPCTDDACDSDSGACTHAPAVNGPALCDMASMHQHLQFTVRTETNSINAPTNNGFQICLGEGLCQPLDVPGYDDLELGSVNEFLWATGGLAPSAITEVSLSPTGEATDAWRPACVSIVADGELIYCNDALGIDWLGTDAEDAPSWTDTDQDTLVCTTCYPTVLSHGPMIGHTTPTSARMWLRTAYSAEVVVRYGTQESLEDAVTLEPVVPTMDEDFVTILELTNLTPGTRYFYEVTVNGIIERSGLSFATAPNGPAAFDVAFGSCSKYAAYPSMPLFGEIAEAAPDVMLMVGDNHYANSSNRSTLRAYYLQHHGVENIAAVIAQTPTWAIWDDHDFTGDNTHGDALGKEHSLAAFRRFWANPPLGSEGYPGVWQSFQWGDVEFFMIDDRYYRSVTVGSMLGEAQLQWLLWGLSTSTATFKVLVSGSQWTQGGTSDSWAVFPDEWQLIVDHIMGHGIEGVLTISGDVHRGEVRVIHEGADGGYPLWEFTSSPLGNNTTNCPDPDGEPDALLFCAGIINYGLLRFDTTAMDPSVTFELMTINHTVLTSHTVTLSTLSL